MENHDIKKPCLVETRRGFSVLYDNKFLYSKYAPEDSINKVIETLEILPGTLILVFSPILGYGLEKLFDKLPENCFVLAIEKETILYDFSLQCHESKLPSLISSKQNFLYLNSSNAIEIAKVINNIETNTNLNGNKFPKLGNFRRSLPIELSGGCLFSQNFYKELTSIVNESISQFWKNRTTLIKLGRLYAGNFFKNLKDIAKSPNNTYTLEDLSQECFSKTILVLGTGLSLENLLEKLKQYLSDKEFREKLYIIAVDASLPVLKQHKIKPDLVVGVEGQLAIEKAYIGSNNSKLTFAQDLLSRPSIKRTLKGKTAYFLSQYTNESFFTDFNAIVNKLNIPTIEALGSVGLVAIEIALLMRQQNTNIFFAGLDFSFLPGKTHSNGAPIHSNLLSNCTKISPLYQLSSSFNDSNFFISGKSSLQNPEIKELTSKALFSYGQHFSKRYKTTKNLYDLSDFGIVTEIPQKDFTFFINAIKNSTTSLKIISNSKAKETQTVSFVKDFLQEHHKKLLKIKNILIGHTPPTELEELLTQCGYLYLHFPDGHLGANTDVNFLKRIRAEINYFLKITSL